LKNLRLAEFEVAVSQLLNAWGWDLRAVGGAGDEGADLVGSDPGGRRAIVQCTRNGPGVLVDSRVVRLFAIGARVIHAVERVVIVTSASYTTPARDLAARHGIELVAASELAVLSGRGMPTSA